MLCKYTNLIFKTAIINSQIVLFERLFKVISHQKIMNFDNSYIIILTHIMTQIKQPNITFCGKISILRLEASCI